MGSLKIVAEAQAPTSGSRKWRNAFVVLFFLALFARVPYYATHDIQEDAYITFRSAFHLADHGNYSFNLGDHASGVTSVLYGPMIASVRLIFASHAIMALSVLNTAIFLAGAALLSFSFFEDWRKRLLLFIAISMWPVGLLVSYTGMEIAGQIALFCTAIYTLRGGRPAWITFAAILLLPLIRPDAIAYSLILSVLVFSFDKFKGMLAVACSAAGVGLILLFNRVTAGSFVTATMRAKEVAYHPSHGIHNLLHNTRRILGIRSYLLPVETKVFDPASYLVTVVALSACVVVLWYARRQIVTIRLLLACFAAVVLVPAAYVFGGVIFPWYFWTSNWLCASVLCFGIVRLAFAITPRARIALVTMMALLWFGLDATQWLVSRNIGLQEYDYRAGVGRWLHVVAKPGDTLELEPAGYIPFYAGLRTYDEVGLISPEVVRFRLRYGTAWYMEFLRQERPNWLVERVAMTHHVTMDRVQLSPQDSAWFDAHYKLVRHFHYSAADYLRPGLLLDLMKHGTHPDYYVYHSTGIP